jgi:hypothetical protein
MRCTNLVAQQKKTASPGEYLSDRVVRGQEMIFEWAIPGLDLFIDLLGRLDRLDWSQCAIRHPNDRRRQVRASRLIVTEPVPFENSATSARWTLLKLARCAVAAETDFQHFNRCGTGNLLPPRFSDSVLIQDSVRLFVLFNNLHGDLRHRAFWIAWPIPKT